MVKGDVSIIKGMGNGLAGIVAPENKAQFQIYLASAGSYDKAKATERDILTTDLTGLCKVKEDAIWNICGSSDYWSCKH